MSLENSTYVTAGLYFLGFGHWFIRFPRVIQTIEFNAYRGSLLHTRTSDGLPLTLGLSFQYRYIPEELHTLYLTYKGEVRRARGCAQLAARGKERRGPHTAPSRSHATRTHARTRTRARAHMRARARTSAPPRCLCGRSS
eukprot:2209496-Prymnesium_polylepis.1